MNSHYDDTMVWTWDTFRKRRMTKGYWFTIYGKLLKCWMADTTDFEMLCNRRDSYAEIEDKLQDTIRFSILGKRMFGSLSTYVAGARLGRAVGELFCKWTTAVEVSQADVDAGIEKVFSEARRRKLLYIHIYI